ncbi:hypothetical protein HXX76_010327 [Chlamydomonas incerta]|uniref:Uncharacterized protein n=1 Tax=Chlamydomonas incerta TaxID=51695 RepID=A0A835VYF7_CHLIN|nr:hypothetical protein HXX76_010327 [Chlamydomonas incerta]|eukprot:KAG2430229.1 hypothetical protein HXX76_010327 [Chlamydomonas incerta]
MKEAKPPPEMVEAMHRSEDLTAPAEYAVRTEVVSHAPHTVLASTVVPQEGAKRMSKQELKLKEEEVKMMHFEKERHNRYDRNHPGAGRGGQGDAGTIHSLMASRGEAGGHMRYGHD